MGCGGSKEAVATGNTSAGGGSKLLRRKSSVVSTGASHTSSTSSSSSSGNTGGVAVNDVMKDAVVVAGEPKADADGEVTSADDAEKPLSVDSKADTIVLMSLEKPAAAAVAVEAKKEEEEVVVLNKDVAADDVASAPTAAVVVEVKKEEAVVDNKDDVASAPSPAAAAMAIEAAAAEPVVEEDLLPESTMADEAPVEDAPEVEEQAKELAPLELKLKDDGEEKTVESKNVEEEEEHKATSPAPTNVDGESAGQMQNTTVPVEAKPAVDEHKAEEKTTDDEQTAATVASEAPAN
ncbi:uncharacterized protein [Miscanthus floridulus]|uniref:uncharacterized protein isoform X1 n=1 Tax=Miscanthus floridulus TaxID=154761 RepID=UPI0034599553